MKVGRVGFEPTMGNPADLQSAALNRSAIDPFFSHIFYRAIDSWKNLNIYQTFLGLVDSRWLRSPVQASVSKSIT